MKKPKKTSMYLYNEDIKKVNAIKKALHLVSNAEATRVALHAFRIPKK